jgi:WD40 repeat protein/serine/threonine protein kinase
VREACAGDDSLRQRVEALLRAHESAGTFMDSPAVAARGEPVTVKPSEQPGDRIGRYKLLQQIGEGGCGVVYMAEQEEPVRRRVALKVIKLGMDTKSVIARFEAERQALAMMDHPNIAKVLDAGATETGRPYFVMELVRGIKITEYCDENNLSTVARLELFVLVCQAIQHAHQKGIIHRDIKPSNILVTINDGEAVPKVIDFGIAKATQGRLTDHTLFTAFEQFLGTPAYMSPEQAVMTSLDIDTRSDIYSLGVLLYELLAGSTPFDAKELMSCGLDAMRKIIREQEPARPSTRFLTLHGEDLTTTAKRRSTDTSKLLHQLRGDLDWIVMKCLEKDRTRRYETANGLAADIHRHLSNEPVVACPPSSLYRLQKSIRRNKGAFAAAALIASVLVAGVITSTWLAVRATRAEREQNRLRQQAERAGYIATRQEQLARESADEAARQQGIASQQELLARRRFYAAQMNLANQAAEAGQPGRTVELLETQRPKTAKEDLRSFEWYHLWGMCNARLRMTLRGSKAPVHCVAISPNGKTLAVASEDGAIRLWDTSTGRQGLTFDLNLPSGDPAFSVSFTPDGRTLAAGYWDGLIRLWDVAGGKVLDTFPGQRGWVRSLAVSPDGGSLVCGGDDGIVKLVNLATKVEQTTHSAHQAAVVSVVFSKDGGKLASASGWGSDGGSIKMWNLASGLIQPEWQITFPGTTALAFSPDGKMLAATGWYFQVWDSTKGQPLAKVTGYSPPINSLAWLPDGKTLASCASDRTVRLWPIPPTNSVVTESRIIGAHLDSATSLAISADGTTLASGANDGSVKLWNMAQTQEQAETQVVSSFQIGTGSTNGAVGSLIFSPDGNDVLGVMEHTTATKNISTGQDYPALSGAAGRGTLSPDGKLLATGDKAGTVKLWDLAGGRLLAAVEAHKGEVTALDFSPDGRELATCGFDDGVLRVWGATAALNLLWGTDTGSAGISALAFSPNGKMVAAIIRHHRVDFFDKLTGRQQEGFQVERGYAEVLSLAFSPDGKLLATGSDSGAVKLWDVETSVLHAALQGHTGSIHAVAFTPDGGTIATCSEDRTVRLWDVATGQERIRFTEFQSGVRALTFSPDGNMLAAASSDAMVRLWRATRVPEATAFAQLDLEGASNNNAQSWPLATDPDPLRRDGIKAVGLAERSVAETDRKNANYVDTLAAAYAETGQFAKAVSIEQEAIALSQSEDEKKDLASRLKLYESHSPFREDGALAVLANASLHEGKFAEAEGPARECLTIREIQIPDDWRTFNAQSMLGGSLLGQKKYAEAEPLLLSGYEGMKQREVKIPPEGKVRLNETLQRLAQLYEATQRPDQAVEWRKKLAELETDKK